MSSLKVSKRNCPIWDRLITEANDVVNREPNLEDFFRKAILSFDDIESSISYVLADQLQQNDCDLEKTHSIIYNALIAELDIYEKISKDMENKVILYDIWTYSCVNCIRTLPHITAWDEKYADQGLLIIGIHSPEFEFEKNAENVQVAIEKYGID